MQFFPSNTNWDFIGRRQIFWGLSSFVVLIAIVSLSVLGFNKGIDFKGGTKIIVSFTADAEVNRGELRDMLDAFVVKESGAKDAGQIEVQDFNTGSGGQGDEKHFLLLTELTSLVNADQKKDLITKMTDAFGEGVQVDVAKEGEDRFFILLPKAANIAETYKTLSDLFIAAGYPKFLLSSDVQRQIEVNQFRQLQMAAEEEGEVSEEVAKQRDANNKAALDKELAKRKDTRYTVTIEEFKTKLQTVMKEQFGKSFVAVQSSSSISPSVAGDLLNQGMVAILYAMLGIIIYITIRFDVRYAPGAIIALMHDVLIVIGCFSIAQIKFTMPIIAAMLTIAGYSINDTIVVFDRIRETIETFPKAPMTSIINHAINATLSRTILTSLTTLLAVLSIFLLGGGLIRDFAFAMSVGVVVGTYSSIFVASPLFLVLHNAFEKRKAAAEDSDTPAYAQS